MFGSDIQDTSENSMISHFALCLRSFMSSCSFISVLFSVFLDPFLIPLLITSNRYRLIYLKGLIKSAVVQLTDNKSHIVKLF